jgi:hypothetical protein
LVEKSCSDDAVVDAARREMALHELAWDDIVVEEGSTSVAEVGTVVGRTWLGRVDHDQTARRQRRESWTVEYGRKLEGTASPTSVQQPLYLEFLKSG